MLDDERPTPDHNDQRSPAASAPDAPGAAEPAAPRKRTRKKAAPAEPPAASDVAEAAPADGAAAAPKKSTAPRKRTRKTAAAAEVETPDGTSGESATESAATAAAESAAAESSAAESAAPAAAAPAVLFQAPEAPAPPRKRARKKAAAPPADEANAPEETPGDAAEPPEGEEAGGDVPASTSSRRRRGRRGRGRATTDGSAEGSGEDADAGPAGDTGEDGAAAESDDAEDGADEGAEGGEGGEGSSASRRRRRRRRRRTGDGGDSGGDSGEETVVDEDGVETVVHVRERKPAAKTGTKSADDGVLGVKGSTRLEAKRQRRREGRDTGRRRPPIITEAEFLARRESVDRIMVVRQGDDRTQIAVLEDGMLVEHYVARKDHTSMVGNVYLGKVQNVLPSMEAAFVDIGRGRNAVLYAGEVNYDASALEGKAPRIEQALKSGQSVLVQVTKDPIGHKGARLTSQVSLPGRYMVYVPDGRLSGISRKLPDTERSRLKGILKRLMPEEAGVIIRTAAEGASEDDLERDLKRLQAQWEDIDKKTQTASAPSMIYGEPDVVIRVIRDIFNEDFKELVVSGADEWDTVDNYVRWVAPDLAERARRWTESADVFAAYRIDEQLAKALDRKVHLPSGGSLVIDRTEAMVVVDVNTGKFTGKGGNLEETVTKNNLEAAEEIVRQLRLRDLGGIIVIDFIDMVLESNRDLVLRRLIECLGRDRTRHQVAEVTSLGLVQMTRKRVGQGLVEAFSEPCKECGGRGIKITHDPVASKRPPAQKQKQQPSGDSGTSASGEDKPKRSRRGRGGGSGGSGDSTAGDSTAGDSAPGDSTGSPAEPVPAAAD